ncbi:unnamed protein product [Auanema sp. JU1783]|nr:unnamed protein product [Auanema sp. JU1783]
MVVEASLLDKLDEVDAFLSGQEGKIERNRDPKMCRHNVKQKCTHCLPIDPYDEEYLKAKDIKHMSFHSYVRKLTEGSGKGSQLKKPLENLRCTIDLTCVAHKPFPAGICTRCKPAVVTLNRQRFRHVDNISFENDSLVNEFLNFWRKSGKQRVGFLLGKYNPFNEVPLGIKATVSAIYEPPQLSHADSVSFIEDENEKNVDKLCCWLGIKRVGWIFSDLWSADSIKGTVHCTRNKDTFLLSAEECITAGHLQSKYPNVTDYSTDRYFGSKFVTVVASGDENETVNFHGYQVSNQCSSLVDAEVLCPSNHPELAYIREKPLNDKHYITDVQYTEKNEYGAEVRKDGRPLPVEYLLVDVPVGMPKEPQFTFTVPKKIQFMIENRNESSSSQNNNFNQYSSEFAPNQFLEQASNFHFLMYLLTNNIVKFTDEEIQGLCKAVVSRDRGAAMDWAKHCINWQQFQALLSEHNTTDFDPMDVGQHWSCKHCTYVNTVPRTDCAICSLPSS